MDLLGVSCNIVLQLVSCQNFTYKLKTNSAGTLKISDFENVLIDRADKCIWTDSHF